MSHSLANNFNNEKPIADCVGQIELLSLTSLRSPQTPDYVNNTYLLNRYLPEGFNTDQRKLLLQKLDVVIKKESPEGQKDTEFDPVF
ncbi:hypothetical protein ONS95_001160 [Cadophora gregata]|uniref:uncharacterized protein n=1 Tax=Cadophora gregata TaxID=51156 RepID=UPI0026DAB911|nr:uncharacterized protein ONS95_001160 [Cadophora gregata]KAK0102035.1 hypothetical protein ONS96_006001 [Cadophora gregata f. sp. sojae]KAK0129225.1 hypothetical protein ONS95_001160 [Cadophora gregata]